MMVTVAPDMTPPLWSVTIPRMRPKLPCEKRDRENSNTPTVAPSTHIAFLARAMFNTEFITPPFSKAIEQIPWESTHLGKEPTTLGLIYHCSEIKSKNNICDPKNWALHTKIFLGHDPEKE
jgi:hypothetical protein